MNPVATALDLSIPLLILQGGRDYQVTEKDFALWRSGLAGRDDVTLKLYPDLNHLFAPGEGLSAPEVYTSEEKHVHGQVVRSPSLERMIDSDSDRVGSSS